jgi:hypothetical protein
MAFLTFGLAPLGSQTQATKHSLDSVHAEVSAALDDSGWVVALHPSWVEPAVGHRLDAARTMCDDPLVVPYRTDLPPLAAAVLADKAAAMAAAERSPGTFLARLVKLEQALLVLAWTPSVTGLERPTPSMRQHVASWWPWSTFAVSLQPDPWVRRINRRAGFDAGLPDLPRGTEIIVGRGVGQAPWVESHLLPAAPRAHLRSVAAHPQGARWWGTSKVVELVVIPAPVEQLTGDAHLADGMACPWCEQPVYTASCPMCGYADAGKVPA